MYSHAANQLKAKARDLEQQANELLAKQAGYSSRTEYEMHHRSQFTNHREFPHHYTIDGDHRDLKLIREAQQLLQETADEQISLCLKLQAQQEHQAREKSQQKRQPVKAQANKQIKKNSLQTNINILVNAAK